MMKGDDEDNSSSSVAGVAVAYPTAACITHHFLSDGDHLFRSLPPSQSVRNSHYGSKHKAIVQGSKELVA